MKYLIAMAVVAGVSGAGWWGWQVTTAREAVVSDYEQEFEGSEAMLATTNETPPAIPVPPLPPAPTTTTYLPPLPEPLNEEGRTRWAAYWEPMTPEEESVYGPRERLPGPPRVGIQVGHWQREALPEELNGLTGSSGANAGGYAEEEVNIMVAREVVKLLTAAGVEVDLLPVAIPIDYRADAFISIHADGSSNTAVSGFKIAPPRTDFSGRAGELVAALYASYESVTSLPRDDAFTRRMSGYYAFNWRRYDHAVHPQTPAVIVEMGFLTNASDRRLMTTEPGRVAQGIVGGILAFLASEDLLQN